MRYVVFEHDPYPDFSWLTQDNGPVYHTQADMRAKRNPIKDYQNPENHIALEMLVYSGDKIIDSLSNIDFLADSDDWTTGRFFYVNDIPKRCRYQRSLARDAGLRYRPRRKNAA